MAKLSLILCLLVPAGCASIRQSAQAISAENVANIETMRAISKDCLSLWPYQSGFVTGALGDALPKETLDAIAELDQIAAKTEPNDYELGLFLGTKIRISGKLMQTAAEKYLPELTEFITILF